MWIVVAIAIVIGGLSSYFTKQDDGPIEQVSEAIIENQLKLPKGSVDLTPNSK